MFSILSLMALSLAVEPTTRAAVCSVNDGQAVPCVVYYDTDESTGAAGLGFIFNETTSAIYVGAKSGTDIDVGVLGINGGDAVEVDEGLCAAVEGAVGCTATIEGHTLKIIAQFQ